MRKAVLCLAPAIAASLFFACDDSSSGGGGGQFTFDGGQYDAPVPILPDGEAPDTGVDAGPAPVTVQVNRYVALAAGITVVWNDANGAILGTGTTDAQGKVVIPAPTPAMVSVLLGSAATATHVVTWTGVAAGDLLRASDIDVTGLTIGHYSVALSQVGIPGTSTGVRIKTGTCDAGGWFVDPTQTFDVPLMGLCASTPGAVLAWSHNGDANPAIDGYSFAKNLTPVVDAGSVNVTTGAWAAPVDFTLSITNLPNGTLVDPYLTEVAGSVAFGNDTFPAPQFDTGGNAVFKIASGFADAQQYGFEGVASGAGGFFTRRIVSKRAAPATAGTLDYADALPLLTEGIVDQSGDAKRPVVTWKSAQSLATTDGGSVNLRWFTGGDFPAAWTIIVPPSATSGTVKVPALPATASAWAPPDPDGGGALVDPPTILFIESDALPGYDQLRPLGGLAIPPLNAGGNILRDIALPSNGKIRLTLVEASGG